MHHIQSHSILVPTQTGPENVRSSPAYFDDAKVFIDKGCVIAYFLHYLERLLGFCIEIINAGIEVGDSL